MYTDLMTAMIFLLVFVSKVNFRFFEMVDVNKTNQTNFRPKVTNKSPKP